MKRGREEGDPAAVPAAVRQRHELEALLEHAGRSQVVRARGFASEADVSSVLETASCHKRRHRQAAGWYGTDQPGKLYLQHGGLPELIAPLVARIKELAVRACSEHWDIGSHEAGELEPRCVEFHQYNQRTKTDCPVHVDTGSVVTADLMLSRAGVDFEGGEMLTRGSGEALSEQPFEYGDCLLFLSHKAHSVAMVTRGERRVLVVEFWRRGKCEGNHRCMGQCATPPARDRVAADD